MEQRYIVPESELIDLLAAYHYANCLDRDGVDNWSQYMIGRKNYLKEHESFEDLAKDDLKYYTKLEDYNG